MVNPVYVLSENLLPVSLDDLISVRMQAVDSGRYLTILGDDLFEILDVGVTIVKLNNDPLTNYVELNDEGLYILKRDVENHYAPQGAYVTYWENHVGSIGEIDGKPVIGWRPNDEFEQPN